MLGPKTSHSKFKKVEIISNIISNTIKWVPKENQDRDKKLQKTKNTNSMEAKGINTKTTNKITEEIVRKLKNTWDKWRKWGKNDWNVPGYTILICVHTWFTK